MDHNTEVKEPEFYGDFDDDVELYETIKDLD